MKVHLYRSERSTWCGRDAVPLIGLYSTRYPVERKHCTHNRGMVNCKTCLKANAAEQRKEDSASA